MMKTSTCRWWDLNRQTLQCQAMQAIMVTTIPWRSPLDSDCACRHVPFRNFFARGVRPSQRQTPFQELQIKTYTVNRVSFISLQRFSSANPVLRMITSSSIGQESMAKLKSSGSKLMDDVTRDVSLQLNFFSSGLWVKRFCLICFIGVSGYLLVNSVLPNYCSGDLKCSSKRSNLCYSTLTCKVLLN